MFSYDETLVGTAQLDTMRELLMDTIQPAQFSNELLMARINNFGFSGAAAHFLQKRILQLSGSVDGGSMAAARKREKLGDSEIEYFDPITELRALLGSIRSGEFMEPIIADSPMERFASAEMKKPDLTTLITD